MRIVAVVFVVLAALAAALALYVRSGGALYAQFGRDVAVGRALAASVPPAPVTEADLAPLPPAVRRYVRLAGAVGRPRVREYRASMRGRIRAAADAPWMPLEVEQVSFTEPPARLFFLRATMKGLPVIGLHRYVGAHATMDVTLAGLLPVLVSAGPEMDESETVTLFNDMCVLAPATLIGPAIVWREVSPDTVAATFTNAGHTISARLVFGANGELVDFVSDDRSQASADGKSFTRARWSTPMREYRDFGDIRLASRGAARWQPASGAYDYAELEMLDVKWLPDGATSR